MRRGLRAPLDWLTRALREPGWERTSLIQAAKAALAAVLAWLVAAVWWQLPQPFLAPYAAVFIVEVTLYRSIRTALQQAAAVGLGVLLAGSVVAVIPSQLAALGVVVLVGLLLGQWHRFGSSGVWVGVTALLLVTYGEASNVILMADRLLEIVLGAVIGLVVNAVLFPPVYHRGTAEATAALAAEFADLLRDMGSTLRADGLPEKPQHWVRRARNAEQLLRRAEEASGWSTESLRLNPRSRGGSTAQWQNLLVALRGAWPHIRELAEAIEHATRVGDPFGYPEPVTREMLAALLEASGELMEARSRTERSLDLATLAERGEEARAEAERQLRQTPGDALEAAAGLASILLPAEKIYRAVVP